MSTKYFDVFLFFFDHRHNIIGTVGREKKEEETCTAVRVLQPRSSAAVKDQSYFDRKVVLEGYKFGRPIDRTW